MNKCTLVIDMNWLLISRVSVMLKQFQLNNPDNVLEAAAEELQSRLAQSIGAVLNILTGVDNLVMIADGGSWRKRLEQPKIIKDVVYKGNRTHKEDIDWDRIFHTLNNFMKHAASLGVTCSQARDVEGDDWAWYWSTTLNKRGINCIIWTSDNDLKQLVKYDGETNTFTAWYNSKAGLWLDSKLSPVQEDDIDFFMKVIEPKPMILESLSKWPIDKSYISPFSIVLEKILMGDAGDNIKPVISYLKNGRTQNFSMKDFEKITEKYDIDSMDDLLKERNNISRDIVDMKKFNHLKRDPSIVEEMIVFNGRLVWLNSRVIPKDIIDRMSESNYKLYDVDYVRSNYKVFIEDKNNEIENIFDSITESGDFNF